MAVHDMIKLWGTWYKKSSLDEKQKYLETKGHNLDIENRYYKFFFGSFGHVVNVTFSKKIEPPYILWIFMNICKMQFWHENSNIGKIYHFQTLSLNFEMRSISFSKKISSVTIFREMYHPRSGLHFRRQILSDSKCQCVCKSNLPFSFSIHTVFTMFENPPNCPIWVFQYWHLSPLFVR